MFFWGFAFFFFFPVWKLLLLPCLCSVEKRKPVLAAQIRKKNLLPRHQVCVCVHTYIYVCVRVLKLLHFHVEPSLLPYFSQAWYDQMSDRRLLVFLWPLAFALGGEKRSKRWQSATSPLIAWQHKDTHPLEAKPNGSNSWNSHWCYKEKENKDHCGKKNNKREPVFVCGRDLQGDKLHKMCLHDLFI